MLANHRACGPEKNSEENDDQAEDQEAEVEWLAFEKADALEDEEGVVHLELPVPFSIFLETDEILAVDFAIEEGLNLFKFFGFAAGCFQISDTDGAVVISENLGFADKREQVNK